MPLKRYESVVSFMHGGVAEWDGGLRSRAGSHRKLGGVAEYALMNKQCFNVEDAI